jgi:hypothetical protein
MVMGAKKFFNACSGLYPYTHQYQNVIEFANKKFSKSTPLKYSKPTMIKLPWLEHM